MNNLPDEIILEVLNKTSDPDIIQLCQTNSRLRRLCQDHRLWINQIPPIYHKPNYLTWYQFYHMLGKYDINRIIVVDVHSNKTDQLIFQPSGIYYIISKPQNYVSKIGNLYDEQDTIPISDNSSYAK